MKFCNRCLYHQNHPLNLTFNNEGICSGCIVHEEKDQLDWGQRALKLESILDNYRNTSGNNYDCIIPVSGARDSYYIVHMVKNVYKMNPLLVTYNKHYNTDVGVRNLANLRVLFDCDILTLTVNPESVKKVTCATMRRFGSVYWHCIAGQTVFPVQIAVKFKIPLIVWGAHQGIDQVGMFSHLDEVEMTRKFRKEHDLMGYEAEDLINNFDEIKFDDIKSYIYPDDKAIERVGVRGIYLNNYIRWDTKAQHEEMIELYNYETQSQTRTFDNYNDVDCYNYSDVHDYIKFIKHGYGKITDHVNREIRLKRLTREKGIQLIQEYSFKKPVNLNKFTEWLGVTEIGFNYIIDQHRNPLFWKRNEKWEWEYIAKLIPENEDLINMSQEILVHSKQNCNFKFSEIKVSTDSNKKYIIIGRGK